MDREFNDCNIIGYPSSTADGRKSAFCPLHGGQHRFELGTRCQLFHWLAGQGGNEWPGCVLSAGNYIVPCEIVLAYEELCLTSAPC